MSKRVKILVYMVQGSITLFASNTEDTEIILVEEDKNHEEPVQVSLHEPDNIVSNDRFSMLFEPPNYATAGIRYQEPGYERAIREEIYHTLREQERRPGEFYIGDTVITEDFSKAATPHQWFDSFEKEIGQSFTITKFSPENKTVLLNDSLPWPTSFLKLQSSAGENTNQ